ncbi:rodlin [Streptomyces sp. NPDC127092]|uniref:rodlin n=1 Tax=Streptomyces sp. NPDC127092 TaxID=3347135 RepID=UPI00364AE8B5
MIKKVLATAAVAATVAGMSATTAMAAGNDGGSANIIGNQSKQSIGSNSTGGYMSPNFGLVNGGVLHCFDIQKVQAQVPIGALIGAGVAVQDVLGNPMSNQTCTQNSVQQKGDDALSHILGEVLSQNGNVGG